MEFQHYHDNDQHNLNRKKSMINRRNSYELNLIKKITLGSLLLLSLIKFNLGNPAYSRNSQIIGTFQSGRNIRNLPCIVKRSGLRGVCMFAIDCLKANGTHLGTCIDSFYFGSCCQMKEDESNLLIDQEISDNSIDQNIISPYPNNNYHQPSTDLSNAIILSSSSSVSFSSSHSKIPIIPVPPITHISPYTSQKPLILNNKFSSTPITVQSNKTGSPSTPPPTFIEQSQYNTTTISATTKYEEFLLSTENIKFSTFQSVQTENDQTTTTVTPTSVSTSSTSTAQTPTVVPTKAQFSTTTGPPKISSSIKPSSPIGGSKKPSNSTRRPTRPSKPSPSPITRRPTTTATPTEINTISAIVPTRPKPTKYRPVSQNISLSSIRPTSAPILSSDITKTSTKRPTTTTENINRPSISENESSQVLTTVSFVQSTQAPRPKPKPTSNIAIIPPTSLDHLIETQTTTQSAPITTTTEKKTTNTPTTITTTATEYVTTTSQTTPFSSTVTENAPTNQPEGLVTWSSFDNQNNQNGSEWILISNVQLDNEDSTVVPQPTLIFYADENKNVNNVVSITTLSEPPEIVLLPESTTPSKPITPLSTVPSSSFSTVSTPSKPIINIPLETVSEKAPPTTVFIPPSISPINMFETTIGLSLPTEDFKNKINESTSTPITITTFLESSTSSSTSTTTVDVTSFVNSSTPSITSLLDESIPTSTVNEFYSNLTTPEITMRPNFTFSSFTMRPISSSSTPSTLEGVDYHQVCGKRMFPEPRIVGGAKAAFGRWPWQISLRQWRTSTYLHKCGAALLNENWAISAAHCVDNVPPSDLLLRLGEYDLAEEEEPYGYQERRVQIVASHPQFDPRTFEYDLALLRFYEPIVFQPNIIPVCVPETDENFIGRTAFVTGWGRLYEDGPLPSVLQEVTVPVINNNICEDMYRSAGYIEHIPNIFICAGWKKGGYDSCEGDSGGPMVIQRDDKRFLLAGIISWGIGCAEPNQPGVYTRISEFRDWINQILQF